MNRKLNLISIVFKKFLSFLVLLLVNATVFDYMKYVYMISAKGRCDNSAISST